MQPIPEAERVALQARLPELRRKWGVPEDAFVFGTFGIIAETKRPWAILSAFKEILGERPDAFLLFVGDSQLPGDFAAEIARRGLAERVRVTGYVDDMAVFQEYLALTDVCLSLRYPSNGETSGSLLRILAAGRPALVTDIGSFADYPEDVVCKVPPPDANRDEIADLLAAFRRLTGNADYRRGLGEAGVAYVEREHAPARCAMLYAEFIERVLGHPATRRLLLADYVGREIACLRDNSTEVRPADLLAPFAAAAGGLARLAAV